MVDVIVGGQQDECLRPHHSARHFDHVDEAISTFALTELPERMLAYLSNVVMRFYLPTMVTIIEPGHVAPREGRVYLTDHFEIEGRLVPESVYQQFFGKTEVARVGGHNVFLVELYENPNERGAPNYRQVGWALMSRRQYQSYLASIAAR